MPKSEDIKRILSSVLQWGISGFNLKDSGGSLAQFRNAADNGWSDVEVQKLRIHGSNGTFYVELTAPALSGNVTHTLPVSGFSGLNYTKITSFSQASSSPLTLDSAPPANGTLNRVKLAVDSPAAGGSPTVEVKFSGGATLMATTDNNLKEAAGQFIVEPFQALGGSPAAIQAVIVTSAQTFSGRIALEYILA